MTGSFFIDGKWQKPESPESFLSLDPGTGKTIWRGAQATEDEINRAVAAAKKAFPSWRALPQDKRIHYLMQYRELILKEKEDLAQVLSLDTGKPLWEAKEEIEAIAKKIPVSIEAYNDRCRRRSQAHPNYTLTTLHKPHGAIAVFGPFNFPGHLPGSHFIPALLAGNTVIFKGSELAPLFAETLTLCFEKAGLPPGVFNLLQGAERTGKYLSSHPSIDGLFFTGSYRVGSQLKKQIGEGKILVLEMGGNNPLVIADVADNEAASYLTLLSCYLTSGQRCSAARRLIVIEGKQSDAFLKVLIPMIKSIQVGHYTDSPEPFMGPVISLQSAEKLLADQRRQQKEGGKIVVEMRSITPHTPFLSPGLIDVTEIKNRSDEECFGPLLQLIRVRNFEEAIQEANRTAYGLTAGIFTQNTSLWEQFLLQVKAGVINWNCPTTGASSEAPFGGLGRSGNFHPSAYYAADYASYPVASQQAASLALPKELRPGIHLLGHV